MRSHRRTMAHAHAFAAKHGSLAPLNGSSVLAGVIRRLVHRNRLRPEELAELLELGLVPHRSAERWRVGMTALAAFAAVHVHASPSSRYVAPDGYRLGQWAAWVRGRYRSGHLTPQRIHDLDSLGFAWELPESEAARKRRAGYRPDDEGGAT